jgi:hypothetical protein
MNGRMAKKLRKELRKQAAGRVSKVYADAKDYKRVINDLPFFGRLKISFRVLAGRF